MLVYQIWRADREFYWGWSVREWSDVKCSDLCEVILFLSEVLEDKITVYIEVTLYWGHLIVLWLF